MNPDQWNRVQSLFKELVDLDRDTRIERLESVKTEDPLLFEELMSLLAADSENTSLIDGFAIDQIDLSSISDLDGVQIGSFQIEKKIGSGGMGSVHLAHRVTGGFEQTVALKLIKYGMGSETAIRRFETERNILARLQHPNIARLVDGGLTSEDHPWFAMEYVEGEDLLSYCNRLNLSVEKRLDLFLDVTEAVQYAHKNLVIHRDLKPGNIMVTGEDNKPLVKLLDFGISQIMDESTSDQTGIKAMTRAYASPEQLEGESTTTATDIYSLGVILYQLISGCHPKEEFKSEDCEPKTIEKELAAISEKGMHSDPAQRYETAEKLAEDIRHFKNGNPVSAMPDSRSYRVKKFVQRHKAGVLSAALILILLLGGIAAFAWQFRVAALERDRAQQEAETSEQIAGFLQGLFELTDPSVSSGDTLTAFTMLERGTDQIEEDLQGNPEILARMYDVLGDAYFNLWNWEKAEEMYRNALDIKYTIYDENHISIGSSLNGIGDILIQTGDFEEADSLLSAALQIRRAGLGNSHPDVAATLHRLGFLRERTGDIDLAEEHYLEALAIHEAGTDDESAMQVASVKNNLGIIANRKAKHDIAAAYYREAIETVRTLQGEDHLRLINYFSNLGYTLNQMGNAEEAEPNLLHAIEVAKKVRGERHPHTAMAMNDYALFLMRRDQFEEAEKMFLNILDIYVEAFGEDHPALSVFYNNLGNARDNLGDYDSALDYHQKSLDMKLDLYGEDHSEVAQSYSNLAATYENMERLDDALEYFQKALVIETDVYGELHPDPAYSNGAIGRIYKKLGQTDEAESHYLVSYNILLEVLGEEHFETENARERLVGFYEETGREDEAERYRE